MTPSNDDTSSAGFDRMLAADPRNVRALIGKADHFAAAGDTRSASAFYLAALRAAPPSGKVPSELLPELRRAQETCARYAREYKDYLRSRLAAHGFDSTPGNARIYVTACVKKLMRFGSSLYLRPGKATRMVSTFSGLNPVPAACKRRKLRISSPAPTNRTRAKATSVTTNTLRNR